MNNLCHLPRPPCLARTLPTSRPTPLKARRPQPHGLSLLGLITTRILFHRRRSCSLISKAFSLSTHPFSASHLASSLMAPRAIQRKPRLPTARFPSLPLDSAGARNPTPMLSAVALEK